MCSPADLGDCFGGVGHRAITHIDDAVEVEHDQIEALDQRTLARLQHPTHCLSCHRDPALLAPRTMLRMSPMATQTPPYLASPLTLLPFVGLTISPTKVGEHAAARATARPYRDVAARLLRWQAQGRILRDRSPAVYVHEYSGDGLTVRGLVGLIPLSRRARSHNERAWWFFPTRACIRLSRNNWPAGWLRCGSTLRRSYWCIRGAPVCAADGRTTKESPLHQFQDRAGQQHRVWAIRGESDLQALQRIIAKTQAIIADGHHRYTAILRLQAEHPGTGWDFRTGHAG